MVIPLNNTQGRKDVSLKTLEHGTIMSAPPPTVQSEGQFTSSFLMLTDPTVPNARKMEVLMKFKGHVKKEFIDVSSISLYMDGLLAIHTGDNEITDLTFLGHSCLCYLIKRIGIQSPESLSQELIDKVITHLIHLHSISHKSDQTTTSHNEKKLWMLTIKVLESLYNINPVFLENSVNGILQEQTNTDTVNTNTIKISLFLINELCQLKLRRDKDDTYPLAAFRSSILTIVNKLSNTGTTDNSNSLLDIITDILSKYFNQEDFGAFLDEVHTAPTKLYISQKHDEVPEKEENIFDVNLELQTIMKDAKGPPQLLGEPSQLKNDYSLVYSSLDKLSVDLGNLLEPFQEIKETEKNWKIRQQNITRIREIFEINQKMLLDERIEFVLLLKSLNFIDAISKTALSLRTTLSLNTCLLIKILLQTFGDDLTLGILDQLFFILKSLLSSTKKLSSQMGYYCILTMFSHTEFHNKLFQNSFQMINEKSVIQRFSSAVILRIMLIRSHSDIKLENNTVYVDEWIKKGISDAQTQVRESMRLTFWYYFKVFPSFARNLLNNSFSTQLKKAIELAIPKHLKINYEKQYQTSYSNSSSNSGSRRSSLLSTAFQKKQIHTRKYPSYAQPTQSSISQTSSGDNIKGQRSVSEFASLHGSHPSIQNVDNKRSKANDSSIIRRKISAPLPSKNHSPEISSNHLDLTDELTDIPSIPLITKYMKADKSIPQDSSGYTKINESKLSPIDKREMIYDSFSDTKQYEKSLHYVSDYIIDSRKQHLEPINFSKLKNHILNIIIEHPLSFAPLLSFPEFLDHISMTDAIILLAINDKKVDDMVNTLRIDSTEKVSNIIAKSVALLDNLTTPTDPSRTIFYLKYRTKIFNFTLLLISRLIRNDISKNELPEPLIRDSIQTLFKIYGNEFDISLFFDMTFVLFQHSRNIFIECLRQLQFISVKLKIAQELQKKDPTFELNKIILHNKDRNDDDSGRDDAINKKDSNSFENDNMKSMDINNTENAFYRDDTEVKGLLEMTMINPFNQKRSTSGNSVIHNKTLSNSNIGDSKTDSTSHNKDMTITDPRLYEMTKIVSLYQNDSQPITNVDTEIKQETNQELPGIATKPDSMLSDIFQGNEKNVNSNAMTTSSDQEAHKGLPPKTEKDHTVKFSDFPVEITRRNEKENDMNEAIKNNEIIPSETKRNNNNASKLQRKISDTREDSNKDNISLQTEYYPVLYTFSHTPITLYELAKIISRKNSMNTPPTSKVSEGDFQHFQKGLLRIKSGTFTLKHLNYLIEPLVMFNRSNLELLSWLKESDGYNEVLSICLTLLQSTDDATLLPTTMTRKAILLIQCTLKLNQLDGKTIENLPTHTLAGIWDQMVIMVEKIADYANEIYLLLCEMRNTLIDIGFFKPRSITSILNGLVTELPEHDTEESYRNEFNETKIIGQFTTDVGNGINLNEAKKKIGLKQSFMLNTIICVLKTQSGSFKDAQFAEIVQTMSYFVGKTNADWRYNSISVTVAIYKILRRRGTIKQESMDRIFSCLDQETYKLIRIMGCSGPHEG